MCNGTEYLGAMGEGVNRVHEEYMLKGQGVSVYVVDRDMDYYLVNKKTSNRVRSGSIQGLLGSGKYDVHASLIGLIIRDIVPEARIISVPISAPSAPTLQSHVITGIREVISQHKKYLETTEGTLSSPIAIANVSMALSARSEPCAGDCQLCRVIDEAAENNIVCAVSAGRSEKPFQRYSIACGGNSRNAITVGNLNDNLMPHPNCGRGPTEDLREKPDIWTYANFSVYQRQRFDGVINPYVSDSGEMIFKGVSYATALVSGGLSLIQSKYMYHDINKLKERLLEFVETREAFAEDRPCGFDERYRLTKFWEGLT